MAMLRAPLIQLALERLQKARAIALAEPYSAKASRTVEAIDELEERAWDALDAVTPRSYGGDE